MTKEQQAIRTEIMRAVAVLHAPGEVVEVRMIGCGRDGTVSGYFDDAEKLADAILPWDGRAPAVYITLNRLHPGLLARAANRLQTRAETTTSDSTRDVVRRRWLPIDCDVTRPKNVSATEDEHQAALQRAREIYAWLKAKGWPDPIVASSGNGGHLLYRLDLPNDAASRTLIERALKALAFQFDDDIVTVDTSMFNASRIIKLYGTLAGKGDSTPDRPHRHATLLHVPEHLGLVAGL